MLTLNQLDVLELVAMVGHITPASANQKTLDALWRRGLVSRQEDTYRLTDLGRQTLARNSA